VLVNLMKNGAESIACRSARFAPQRGAARGAQAHGRRPGSVVEFSVQDTGKGLAPRCWSGCLKPSSPPRQEGMGMGLNLCRSIVESHQGRMQARTSTMERRSLGCRFSFWLPLAAKPADDTTNSVANDKPPKDNCMSLIPKKGTVYVVDDDEAVRDSLQWLLEGKDYRVRCFDSAETFLSRYDPREVACLIVDIRMGGMTGLELQDRLIERKSPLPIVFITGHGDVPMAVNTMKKGALDFIQKPFKEDQLVGLVERMLDHAREAFADFQQPPAATPAVQADQREAQVLERIVAGRLNKQIADDLGISIKTVEAHRANIMEKLNANTVADLLKIALGQNAPKGLIAPIFIAACAYPICKRRAFFIEI
jgi:FixJ family two-component response regulator